MTDVLLDARDISTFYGKSQILFGVGLNIRLGEVVTLMGRNGMGKTTLVRSVIGLTRPRSGSVVFDGEEVTGLPAAQVARRGIALVPEVRKVFPNLSVQEHLIIAQRGDRSDRDRWSIERILKLFPSLSERLGNLGSQLSGGEQQMLAIGMALITNPKLIILDEATEGLAPLLREEIWACLGTLKKAGQSILVIDKSVDVLVTLADRHLILEKGHLVWSGTSDEFTDNPDLYRRYLGV